MFANTNIIRSSQHISTLAPVSSLVKTSVIPINIQRRTNQSFLYCDIKDHTTTNLIQCSFNSYFQFELETVEEFLGEYEYSCFGDDHTFLLNKQGDIAYYDNLTKNTIFMEKQHPSLFHPVQIHNRGQLFITCGGNVKNSHNENEKIIKVWKPYEDEELVMKSRIVTGHNKPIENSLVLARNRVVTLSSDRTVRCVNLATEQIESVLPVEMIYYSGCQLDWNSLLLGGIGSNLSIFDARGRRMTHSKLSFPTTQISKISRVNSHHCLLSNVNTLYLLDLRMMAAQKKGEYEGQRISEIASLSESSLFIGNYDKSFQIWQSS